MQRTGRRRTQPIPASDAPTERPPLTVYYNEIDPYAAQWLRNLIKVRLIPDGEVDDRGIRHVEPDDLQGFTQCHFFAGIAGWSYALKLAGWPDDNYLFLLRFSALARIARGRLSV